MSTDSPSHKKSAILVDPGCPEGLAAVLSDLPLPMVPVGTKPLIQHWIERLANAGYEHIRVLLNHLPERTRAFVGDGSRWGVEISHALYRQEQDAETRWPLVADLPADGLFCAEIGSWLDPEVESALAAHADTSGAVMTTPVGDGWLRSLLASERCDWHGLSVVELEVEDEVSLSNVRSLWQLNMDMVEGRRADPLPYGFEAEPGLWAASNCSVHDSVAFIGAVFLGESSIVGRRAGLGPGAVVADHVVIEEGAQVQRSVLFPRTFVGSHIVLSDVVVAGDVLYRIEDDVVLHINDLEIIARRDRRPDSVSPRQRLVALLMLLVLMVPMLAVMLVRRISGGRGLVEELRYAEAGRSLDGSREFREILLVSLDVRHPIWRKVPWLFKTLRGELPLVGSSLRLSNEVAYPSWITDAEVFSPGVITLADVTGVDETDTEATIVADVYQLSQGKRGTNFSMLLKWLARLVRQ